MKLTSILFTLLLLGGCEGIYFEIRHAQRECFLLEMPAKVTAVQGKWDVFANGATVSLEATNTRRDVVYTTQVVEMRNSFTFQSTGDMGSYNICWRSENRERNAVTKIKFELHVAHASNDRLKKAKATPKQSGAVKDEAPTADELEDFHFEMEHAEGLMEDILAASADFRGRQELFKQTAQDIDSNVWWFGVIQVALMIALTLYQLRAMKTFLYSKKVV
eukprot:TRINITY_DN14140_c0_g1_i1.p1 TRINITY_DN14140_c0_g1~~TRINITY_DN14140_c0_g1_i1.p1  ORF type:complete len:219 (+),score=40.04 TRINITY_DN14140_c0_g1_i1:81-737(+)